MAPIPGPEVKVTNLDRESSAAKRERWLAELSLALDEARELAAELSQSPGLANESAQIAQWVDHAITRVASLRRGQPVAIADILGPKWFGLSPDRADRRD
jgi:hypothetical protein